MFNITSDARSFVKLFTNQIFARKSTKNFLILLQAAAANCLVISGNYLVINIDGNTRARSQLRASGVLGASPQRGGFTCLTTRLSFVLETSSRE